MEELGLWAPRKGRQGVWVGGSSSCPPQEEVLDGGERKAWPVCIHPPGASLGTLGKGMGRAKRQKWVLYGGLLEALRVNKPEQQSQMGMGVLGLYPT